MLTNVIKSRWAVYFGVGVLTLMTGLLLPGLILLAIVVLNPMSPLTAVVIAGYVGAPAMWRLLVAIRKPAPAPLWCRLCVLLAVGSAIYACVALTSWNKLSRGINLTHMLAAVSVVALHWLAVDLLQRRQRANNSSKPTPLRGAA